MTTNLPQSLSRSSVTGLLRDRHFLGGLAVGSVVTLVLANPDVQRALFRGVARVALVARSGLEEIKERFHDAEAEVVMEESAEDFDDDADDAAANRA